MFQVDDDRGQQVEAGEPVVLSFLGSVSQFTTLVEIDGALEGMVRLSLVQSDLGAPAHVGVRGPVDQFTGLRHYGPWVLAGYRRTAARRGSRPRRRGRGGESDQGRLRPRTGRCGDHWIAVHGGDAAQRGECAALCSGNRIALNGVTATILDVFQFPARPGGAVVGLRFTAAAVTADTESRVPAHSGRVGLASVLTSPGAHPTTDVMLAGNLEDQPHGGALLCRGDRRTRCRGALTCKREVKVLVHGCPKGTWWRSGVPTRRERSGATTGCGVPDLLDLDRQSWRTMESLACARVRLLVEQGECAAAGEIASRLCDTASAHGLTRTTLLRGLALSMVVAERAGQTAGALARLVEFLGRTREVDYVRPLVRHREVSRTVLHRLLGTDLDTDVRRAAESMLVHVGEPATATAPIFSARERDVLAVLVEVGEDIRNTATA